MSAPKNPESHPAQPLTDAELIHVHQQVLADKADDRGHYRLLPLVLLFVMGGLIFYGGTYLNEFSGKFDPFVFDERGGPPEAPPPVKPDLFTYGKTLYPTLCAACHQANGLGIPGLNPPLAKSEWVLGSEERVIRIVMHGLTGPITVAGQNYGMVPMPAPGWNDDQIAAVVTYIRGNKEWGNDAAPVTPEKVKEIRAKEGNRGQWTAAELEKLP